MSTTAAVPDRARQFLAALRRRPGQALLGTASLALFAVAVALLWPPARAFYHARAAERAAERWEFDEARAHLAVCLEIWPDSASIHFQAARAARRAGKLDEAQEHLSRSQSLAGPSPRTDREWALLRAERGEVEAVEDYLKRTVGPEDPDAPLVLEALARGYLRADRPSSLLESTALWLQARPRDTHALYFRGLAFERLGDRGEAVAAFRESAEADPDNAAARLRLGELLLSQAAADEALPQFEAVRAKRPADPAVLLGVARCRRALGQAREARDILDRLLADRPDDARALAEWGRLALAEGDAAGAEARLRRAVELAPDEREALHALIQSLRAQEDKRRAADELEPRLRDLDDDLRRLGELLRAVDREPRDPAPRTEAARICLRHGRKDEGLRWLASVLRLDPGYAPARELLAAHVGEGGAGRKGKEPAP
ncbi:MAG TPA: tetratricopeptide repeat protein [Gemmataceae bacterium]|nr:tetratricopeptide repeat protein [Gemmataceae bacterium]